jgi:DNA-binding transcriptional LysR family regulator
MAMNLARIDLNLLIYLDALLREGSVTRAAQRLNITQPAMSNGLKRLRELFGDPLLVRTSDGMLPSERALELQPLLREVIATLEKIVEPVAFDPADSEQLFRIVASDYAEATLLPGLLKALRERAPGIALDILTPSDASFQDVEKGKVDMAINRFDYLPGSFHAVTLWRDGFCCLLSRDNPVLTDFTLDAYLGCRHIWVSKTGMGPGIGMTPNDTEKLGWVDEALAALDSERRIRIYTRHYQVAAHLAVDSDLIATLPARLAQLHADDPRLAMARPPFPIVPIELKLAWSPLLHHNPGHVWLRGVIQEIARAG